MKTKRYTAALLIALIFATASIQAQSARRPASQQKKEQTRTTNTSKKEAPQRAKTEQPARKVQSTQARSLQNRNSQAVRNVQSTQARSSQNRNSQAARNVQSAQARTQQNRNGQAARNVQSTQARKPVSLTTTKNPRSTYRTATNVITAEPRRTTARNTQYRTKSYYGGIHYHYAYPTRKVSIHYHYNTYVNHYRVLYYPTFGHIYWTRSMYRDYRRWYPEFHWRYNYGYMIQTISVFDAKYNLGEVAMVYGRVYASWYNNETDDYLLFFGGDFPYQEFTTVVPGHVARRFSRRPEEFFLGQHVTITGLITTYDGSPEIVVRNRSQLRLY